MIDWVVTLNNKKMTSLDPFEMWSFLQKAKQAWCTHVVVETSSHALYFHRVYGLRYDVAVLSNISHDHLDLHHTMENYVDTKLLLFKNLYKYGIRRDVRKVWVVNRDTEYAERFTSREIAVDSMYTYSVRWAAQVSAQNIIYTENGTEFDVKMPSEFFHIHTKLLWEFNVSNILAGICVFVSQQLSVPEIQRAIASFEQIAGRMEQVPNPLWLTIYVDYAHTEDSLRAVLDTIQKMYPWKRILTVFWATGDRDKTKRPKMGEVVSTLSDVVIVTDDDTYTEDSKEIIREIVTWIPREEGEDFWVIPNREDAIRTALVMMRKDDVLLLAGKWSENVQVTQKGSIPWNDRFVTERLISEIEKQELMRG